MRVINRNPRNLLDPVLEGIGQVGDDLHSLSQVIASALALDNVLVNLPGGDIVFSSEGDIEVSLVVAKVEVAFSTVVKDKDFAVPASNVRQFLDRNTNPSR